MPPASQKFSQNVYERGEGAGTLEIDWGAHPGSAAVPVSKCLGFFHCKLGGNSSLQEKTRGYTLPEILCKESAVNEGWIPVSFLTHTSFPHAFICLLVFPENSVVLYRAYRTDESLLGLGADFVRLFYKLHWQKYKYVFHISDLLQSRYVIGV